MSFMQALFLTAPRQVAIGPLEAPSAPGPGQILVQVSACSICGGDLKTFRAPHKPLPHFLFGHEMSGRVAEVGPGVERFRPGDRIAYVHNNYCGVCAICRAGSAAWCQELPLAFRSGGGYADYVLFDAPARGCGIYPIPETLDDEIAALAEPVDCALGAALRAQPLPGEVAVVIGLGGMGHLIAQILHAMQVHVIGIDTAPAKCALAAPYCLATVPASDDASDAVRQEVLARTAGHGADVVFEAVGVQSTLVQAFALAKQGGRIILVGVFEKPMDYFDPQWIFRRDLTVIPAKGPQPLITTAGESLAFEFLRRSLIDPRPVIRTFARREAQAAFEAQDRGEVVRAVILSQ